MFTKFYLFGANYVRKSFIIRRKDHHPVSLGWTVAHESTKDFGFSIFLVGHDVAIADISPCTYI